MPATKLQREIGRALGAMGIEAPATVVVERPRNPEHGDFATNVALTLSGRVGRPPRQIAEQLLERLDFSAAGLRAAEVAGPGFINFRLADDYLREGLERILSEGESFGRSAAGSGEPLVVEFVSANPTGPLHVGHGRQAALGDAIAELLSWTGFDVQREYYYNDAGEQINRLTRSVWARYQEELGETVEFPADGYHGAYVSEIARALVREHGDRFRSDDSDEALDATRRAAVWELMREIERDLAEFRVGFDHFFLESSLYSDGRVADTVARLRETGLTFEKDGALWLDTTRFGDQKPRVMVKGTGHPTYFLPDVAYHLTKWERGFHRATNVQGADHHGTVTRVQAGVQALGLPKGYPEYVLHQMVTFVRGEEEVKISKRAGDYVTLRDLFEEVGVDVARYFFLMRRAEAQLTFDLDLALERSDKNPVYKIQYAHARMCSIFRKAGVEAASIRASEADLDLLTAPAEAELIKTLLRLPEVVEGAAEQRAPHLVCTYLEETAGTVNTWYHAGNLSPELRVIGVPEPLSRARLVLARAVQLVLRNGLAVLGISAPSRMEREDDPLPS